jgi:hypothetical protein
MTDLKTIILEDDDTKAGGTSFAGETLEDFLLSINTMPKQPLDDADKWHTDSHLVQNGIKPVFNITKSDAFITLYKRLFKQMDTYCEEHDLTVIDHGLIKDRCLITNKQDYKNAESIDFDIEAPSGSFLGCYVDIKPLTTDYNTIEDYLQDQLKVIINNIKDRAYDFNADDSFRDTWSDDCYLTPSEFLRQLQEDEEFLHEFAKQKD